MKDSALGCWEWSGEGQTTTEHEEPPEGNGHICHHLWQYLNKTCLQGGDLLARE